jgi:hypothetical protein
MTITLQNTDGNIFVSTSHDIWVGLLSPVLNISGLKKAFDLHYSDKPVLKKTIVQFYQDAPGSRRAMDVLYENAHVATKTFIETCRFFPVIQTLFTLGYGDYAQVKRTFDLRYKDFNQPNHAYDLNYDDANVVIKSEKLSYDPTTDVTRKTDLKYSIFGSAQLTVSEHYPITSGEVKRVVNLNYDLEGLNRVQKVESMPYYLLSGSVIHYTPSVSVSIDGKAIDFISFNIEISSRQYCFISDIQVSESDYSAISNGDIVEITVDGETYVLFVESKYKEWDIAQRQYMVQCLSPTVKLDKPYSTSITQSYVSDITASSVVMEMAAIQDITVDYQLFDWPLNHKTFYIQDETPIDVIRRITSSVGGVIQTKPNGDMLIISEYPVSPKDWATVTPDGVISVDEEVFNISESPVVNLGHNAFVVTNEEAIESRIWLDEKPIGRGKSEIRGFRIPFSDGTFDIQTSRKAPVTIAKDLYFTELSIPEIENEDDLKWEYVEFIEWEGRTLYPIYSIIDYEWADKDLGAFTFHEDGRLLINDMSAVPSEGLLKIKYITRFWRWEVQGPVDTFAQIFVPKL